MTNLICSDLDEIGDDLLKDDKEEELDEDALLRSSDDDDDDDEQNKKEDILDEALILGVNEEEEKAVLDNEEDDETKNINVNQELSDEEEIEQKTRERFTNERYRHNIVKNKSHVHSIESLLPQNKNIQHRINRFPTTQYISKPRNQTNFNKTHVLDYLMSAVQPNLVQRPVFNQPNIIFQQQPIRNIPPPITPVQSSTLSHGPRKILINPHFKRVDLNQQHITPFSTFNCPPPPFNMSVAPPTGMYSIPPPNRFPTSVGIPIMSNNFNNLVHQSNSLSNQYQIAGTGLAGMQRLPWETISKPKETYILPSRHRRYSRSSSSGSDRYRHRRRKRRRSRSCSRSSSYTPSRSRSRSRGRIRSRNRSWTRSPKLIRRSLSPCRRSRSRSKPLADISKSLWEEVDPTLAKKLEDQKRLREKLIRQKELRRLEKIQQNESAKELSNSLTEAEKNRKTISKTVTKCHRYKEGNFVKTKKISTTTIPVSKLKTETSEISSPKRIVRLLSSPDVDSSNKTVKSPAKVKTTSNSVLKGVADSSTAISDSLRISADNTRRIIVSGDSNETRIKSCFVLLENFSSLTSKNELYSLAESVGKVDNIEILKQAKSKEKESPQAIIKFITNNDAAAFVRRYNKHLFNFCRISVKLINNPTTS